MEKVKNSSPSQDSRPCLFVCLFSPHRYDSRISHNRKQSLQSATSIISPSLKLGIIVPSFCNCLSKGIPRGRFLSMLGIFTPRKQKTYCSPCNYTGLGYWHASEWRVCIQRWSPSVILKTMNPLIAPDHLAPANVLRQTKTRGKRA